MGCSGRGRFAANLLWDHVNMGQKNVRNVSVTHRGVFPIKNYLEGGKAQPSMAHLNRTLAWVTFCTSLCWSLILFNLRTLSQQHNKCSALEVFLRDVMLFFQMISWLFFPFVYCCFDDAGEGCLLVGCCTYNHWRFTMIYISWLLVIIVWVFYLGVSLKTLSISRFHPEWRTRVFSLTALINIFNRFTKVAFLNLQASRLAATLRNETLQTKCFIRGVFVCFQNCYRLLYQFVFFFIIMSKHGVYYTIVSLLPLRWKLLL